MNDFFNATKKKLIVSCQALENEPLHGSDTMAKMALAAMWGGAAGIRANSVSDIRAISNTVSLPIIGIIKKEYENSSVYITPTMEEVDALVQTGVAVIATDCTARVRPHGMTLEEFFPAVREKYPNQLFMADCSNLEDARLAEKLKFDIVSTTLCGYTEYTKHVTPPSFTLLQEISNEISLPLIAEGGIWSPEVFARVMALDGVHAVVIGSAITRPMEITKHYLAALSE